MLLVCTILPIRKTPFCSPCHRRKQLLCLCWRHAHLLVQVPSQWLSHHLHELKLQVTQQFDGWSPHKVEVEVLSSKQRTRMKLHTVNLLFSQACYFQAHKAKKNRRLCYVCFMYSLNTPERPRSQGTETEKCFVWEAVFWKLGIFFLQLGNLLSDAQWLSETPSKLYTLKHSSIDYVFRLISADEYDLEGICHA